MRFAVLLCSVCVAVLAAVPVAASAAELEYAQIQATDPERAPLNPCAHRGNECNGDARFYWGDKGLGLVRDEDVILTSRVIDSGRRGGHGGRMTATASTHQPGWSVDMFEAFWANPDPALVPPVLTEDVVGHWPGRPEPVRGRDDYTACIARLVETLPGMRLEVADSAVNGDLVFVRWVMHATGDHGPFRLDGIDRVRVRGPQVAENFIVCDTAAFRERSGRSVPWASG